MAKSQADMDRIYDRVVRRFAESPSVTLLRLKTEEAFPAIPDGALDWIYIDGNHEYSHVCRDLEFAERKVRPGGIIAGDDYDRGEGAPITRAVADHLRLSSSKLEWVAAHQFVLRRTTTGGCA